MKYFVVLFFVLACTASLVSAQEASAGKGGEGGSGGEGGKGGKGGEGGSPGSPGKGGEKCKPCCNGELYKALCNKLLKTVKEGKYQCADNTCQPKSGPKGR